MQESSAGLFKVEQLNNGKHGPSYRLEGLDPQLNDNARRRGIIIHAGYYVSLKSILLNWKEKFRLGRSHGVLFYLNVNFPAKGSLMNKLEMISILSRESNISKAEAAKDVQLFFDFMDEAFVNEERVNKKS